MKPASRTCNLCLILLLGMTCGASQADSADRGGNSESGLVLTETGDAWDGFVRVRLSDEGAENAGGPNSGDCDGCDDSCGSHACLERYLTVRAQALLMNRSTPESEVLMQGTAPPTSQLNADQFEFDVEAGFEIAAILQWNDCWAIDGRFFSVDSWTAEANATPNSTPGNPLQLNSSPVSQIPDVQTIDATYDSNLRSVSTHLRRRASSNWTWLAGARYVELKEHLGANLVAPTQTARYDVATRNFLVGFEAGAEALLISTGRLQVEAVCLAGIYGNRAQQDTVLNTGFVLPAAGQSNKAAFVGELILNTRYCLTDRLSVISGTQLLWIDSVALAGDQLAVTDFFNQSGIEANGSVFYYGATFGLQWTQ